MLTNGQCLALNHHESKAQVTLIMNSSPPNTTSINLFPDQLSLLKLQKKISKFLPQQNSYILHYQPCWNLKLHGTFPTAIITSRIIKLVHKTLRLKRHTQGLALSAFPVQNHSSTHTFLYPFLMFFLYIIHFDFAFHHPLHFTLNINSLPVYCQATCQSCFLPEKYWFFSSSL